MARLAYRFAMSSPRVTTEAIEANSFQQLSMEASVRAVPHTVVHGDGGRDESVIGAVPERMLLDAVTKATAP